jgi:hypothetical protein
VSHQFASTPAANHGNQSAVTGQNLSLSFTLPPAFSQQPPKYEEIMWSEEQPSFAMAPPPFPSSPDFPCSPPPPFEVPSASGPSLLPSASANHQTAADSKSPSSVQLIRAFGKYGEISTQPGAFRAPSRISVTLVCDAGVGLSGSSRVVVVDRSNQTVQVFTEMGECLSMFKADGVGGCFLWPDGKKLVAGTDKGVEVFDMNGSRLDHMPIGPVVTVVRCEPGFIAVQPRSLTVCKGSTPCTLTRTVTAKIKPGQYNRLLPFDDICDVAVNSQQDLVVLEGTAGGGLITIITDEGFIKSTIIPAQIDSCGRLQSPIAVAVDSLHNVIVSESGVGGRILLFGANGRLLRALFHARLGSDFNVSGQLEVSAWPAGLAVGPDDRLYVTLRSEKFAEIRVFSY